MLDGSVDVARVALNGARFENRGRTCFGSDHINNPHRAFGRMIASDDLVQQARTEAGSSSADFTHLVAQPPLAIRGLEQPLGIWIRAAHVS